MSHKPELLEVIMKCLNCDGSKFEVKNCHFTPEIKGEEVEVIVPAMICSHCSTPLMDDAQMSHLRKTAEEVYRKNHIL